MRKKTIASIRQRTDDLTFSMQTFCLHPGPELFAEICADVGMARNEGDNFCIWRSSVIYRHGDKWGLAPDDWLSQESKICKNALDRPTKTTGLKVIHIFFATGELKYIDLFYQMMGHMGIPLRTRQYFAGTFTAVKDMYLRKLNELTTVNPRHLEEAGIRKDVADFSYFDDIAKKTT